MCKIGDVMLKTEMRNPRTMNLDKMSTRDMVQVINDEMKKAVFAIDEEVPNIEKAVDVVAERIKNGGRLIYMGAGTSGRLGILDAAECPPTFGVDGNTVVGIMAGGDKCLRSASEDQEDSSEAAIVDLKGIELTGKDALVGISVAGGAQYVIEALNYAKSLGCATIAITSNKGSKIDEIADISICPDTGAEVVTGSTRMKAGTAQKIILNMLSTCAMIKQGYVYENLMINLKPTNIKLKKRVISIVMDIMECSEEEAVKGLEANNWVIKDAICAMGK